MRELKPLEIGTRVETIFQRCPAEIIQAQALEGGGWKYEVRWENEWRAPEWLHRAQFLLRDLPNPESAP